MVTSRQGRRLNSGPEHSGRSDANAQMCCCLDREWRHAGRGAIADKMVQAVSLHLSLEMTQIS
jgi:hypothetical protein